MMNARMVSRCLTCCLLAVATVTHAECGWVLWNDEARLDHAAQTEARFWHPIAGAPNKVDCEARLREEINRVMSPDNRPKDVRFKVYGDAVQVMYFRSDKPDEKMSRVQTFRYVCLPENVDPRAPRAK